MGRLLRVPDVEMLAQGAKFLGVGGGGSTRRAALVAKYELERARPVALCKVQSFTGLAAVVGVMGDPHISSEKLSSCQEIINAVQVLSRVSGAVDAVSAIEIGGSNALFPLATAARLGLPLLDSDAMGRAFPRLGMSTLYLGADHTEHFIAFADVQGHFTVVPASDSAFVERMAASVCQTFGGRCAFAFGPLRLPDERHLLIEGSYTRALQTGHVLMASSSTEEIAQQLGIPQDQRYRGKITGLFEDRWMNGSRSGCLIETMKPKPMLLRLDYRAEFHMLSTDGRLLAALPGLIVVMDAQSLIPLSPADLCYGQVVDVLTLPAPSIWYTGAGMARVGPRAFGYHAFGDTGASTVT